MENLKFFFTKREYLTFRALKDYLCEDLIRKIIEYDTKDKRTLYNLNNLTMELRNYQYLFINENRIRPIPSPLLFLSDKNNNEYSIRHELYSHIDIFRILYLKNNCVCWQLEMSLGRKNIEKTKSKNSLG